MDASLGVNALRQAFSHCILDDRGPHLYRGENPRWKGALSSLVPFSIRQLKFFNEIDKDGSYWQEDRDMSSGRFYLHKLREYLALSWLSFHGPGIQWHKCLAYLDSLRARTHESRQPRLNMLIRKGHGSCDVSSPGLEKIFDPLARDPGVYFTVDQELRFIAYDEVMFRPRLSGDLESVAPELLQGFLSMLEPEDFFVHLTPDGDVLVAQRQGLLASLRGGQWYLYDSEALVETMEYLTRDAYLARHLLECLLDLSYRRHGALLVLDQNRGVMQHLSNHQILEIENRGQVFLSPHSIIAPSLDAIHLASSKSLEWKKHIVLELAEIDGALIFDGDHILAFGAMIAPHPSIRHCFGSRSLAAESALLWGGLPFMVSCDGEISINFFSGGSTKARRILFS